MIAKILLLLMVFAIPIVGISSSKLMQSKFDETVREDFTASLIEEKKNGLSQDEYEKYSAVISQLTLPLLCESDTFGPSLKDSCLNYNLIKSIELGSYVASAIGLLIIFYIFIAGLFARISRYLLLLLFKPGIYVTLFLSCILILINAGITVATLYYLPVVYFGRFYPIMLLIISVGALAGVVKMMGVMFKMVKKVEAFETGIQITKEEQPKLWEHVSHLAKSVGTNPPQNIILGLEPNFYVTEANVNCLGKRLTGRTMYLSLPLMRILNEKEIRSVIGHELGHFIGLDTRFSTQFYPIYRGISEAMEGMQSLSSGENDSSAMILSLIPAMGILGFFLSAFSIAENKISRERELAADKIGAKISDAPALATALLKLHAFSDCWLEIQKKNAEMLQEDGSYIPNQSLTFQSLAQKIANPDLFKSLNDTCTSHPTDSHPPLSIRLTNLGIKIADVQASALNFDSVESGINLFNEAEKIENQISVFQSLLLARRLGIDIENTSKVN